MALREREKRAKELQNVSNIKVKREIMKQSGEG